MAERVTVRADEVTGGTMKKIEVDGEDVLVVNVGDVYYALEATCPHGRGNLWEGSLEDHILVCPTHGARFDVRTGRLHKPKTNYYGLPYGGPATRDLKTYVVRVADGDITIVL